MSLIERYVLAVTERLPEDIREDVAEELRSNIADMLPENAGEDQVREVLEKMGNPKKLAEEYNPTKKYLIGPGLYDRYISMIQLVVGIVVVVLAFITVLDWAFNRPQDSDPAKMFSNLLEAIISGGLQAAFWVTLVFAIIERSGMNEGRVPFSKKKWTVEDLPVKPVSKKSRISRVETCISLFFTILFTAIVYFQPGLISAHFTVGNNPVKIVPLFDIPRLDHYLSAILVLAVIQLVVTVWKFIQGKWTIPLAAVNAFQNAALSILVIFMFNDRSLFNNEFFSTLAEKVNETALNVTDAWFWGTSIFTIVIFAGICLWDSISAFIKARK